MPYARNFVKIQSRDEVLNRVQDQLVAVLSGALREIDSISRALTTLTTTASGISSNWVSDSVLAQGFGTVYTLTRAPASSTALLVFRNGALEEGWTLTGSTLTLGTATTSSDASLIAHYQY
jgi:hypothetical protein